MAIGDHVLDIGCGTGQTTRDAARLARDGGALGIDLSRNMIELAPRLAVELDIQNATFEQADAQIHPLVPASFDVAISRTSTMFFGDPQAAFANIARALRPGGTITMLVWRGAEHNEWTREFTSALTIARHRPAPAENAPGPLALADPGHVETLLTTAGFADVELLARRAPMWFGADPDDANRFVLGLLGWMLDSLDDTTRSQALDELRATTTAHQTSEGVLYDSGTWLVRARRP